MCFSAVASFTAAGLLGAAGVYTLSRVRSKPFYLLASFPVLFAFQQMCEGFLWLQLRGEPSEFWVFALSYGFLFFAEFLWPLIVSVAVFLIEPCRKRRNILVSFVGLGLGCAAYLLWGLHAGEIITSIQEHHIVYDKPQSSVHPNTRYLYIFVTVVPFLLSSHRVLHVFGLAILLSYGVAIYMAHFAYVSVWCFFAALLSAILCFAFWKKPKGFDALS